MSYPGPPEPPVGMAACVRHPDRGTTLACSRCGRPACVECLRNAPVGYQCVDCVAAGHQVDPRVAGQQVVPHIAPGGAGQQAVPPAAGRLVRPAMRTPYLTYLLIGLNVAAFIATVAQSHSLVNNQQSSLFADWVLVPGAVAQGQWIRLFGSAFLHFGPLHLAMNMWCLYVCGRFVEVLLGPARFLALYLVSLLGGSAAVMILSHNAETAGASGAIFGLFGIQAVILWRLRQNVGVALGVIAVNLIFSFSIPGIAIWGHIGGLIAGTAAGAGMLYGPQLVGDPRGATVSGKVIAWSSVVAVAAMAVVAVAIEISTLHNAAPVG